VTTVPVVPDVGDLDGLREIGARLAAAAPQRPSVDPLRPAR